MNDEQTKLEKASEVLDAWLLDQISRNDVDHDVAKMLIARLKNQSVASHPTETNAIGKIVAMQKAEGLRFNGGKVPPVDAESDDAATMGA
jgi:hypothetical protein